MAVICSWLPSRSCLLIFMGGGILRREEGTRSLWRTVWKPFAWGQNLCISAHISSHTPSHSLCRTQLLSWHSLCLLPPSQLPCYCICWPQLPNECFPSSLSLSSPSEDRGKHFFLSVKCGSHQDNSMALSRCILNYTTCPKSSVMDAIHFGSHL